MAALVLIKDLGTQVLGPPLSTANPRPIEYLPRSIPGINYKGIAFMSSSLVAQRKSIEYL
jgi:hypothetical protein